MALKSIMVHIPLRLKIAQKPYVMWSLGPRSLKYESLEPQGSIFGLCNRVWHMAPVKWFMWSSRKKEATQTAPGPEESCESAHTSL